MPSHSRSCGYVSISLSFGNRLNTSKLKSLKIHQKKNLFSHGANDNETKRLLWHMQCANHFVMCRVDECVSRMNKYENNRKSQMTARHAQMIFASVADVATWKWINELLCINELELILECSATACSCYTFFIFFFRVFWFSFFFSSYFWAAVHNYRSLFVSHISSRL